MPERFFDDDDRHYVTRYERRDINNSSTWLVPLLLLPIAFLAGWVANGYVAGGQLNQIVPGIQTGVGGGPGNEDQMISPLPTSGVEEPTVTLTPTPTISVDMTPTVSPRP